MNKRLKQRVNRRSDLYKNLRNLTRAFTLINGYASRTASQYQPRTSLFSETAAWSKAHDLVQNTDHPSLLSPFGITPKFCRAVSIDARILYDLGSHKIQKKTQKVILLDAIREKSFLFTHYLYSVRE